MGADGNLIKAAGQMGPKAWDYSGIIRAIDAIGKYTAHKRAFASELTSWGDQNIDVNSVPEGLLSGTYGDQNMDFVINQRTKYKNAVNTIGKLFPGAKKYKNAVKTINNTKKTLEKNKADIIIWNGIWNKRNEYFTKMSKGTPFQVEDRVLDLAMDGSTNSLGSNLAYTDTGVVVATPQYMQDIDGNEIIDVTNITDFLNGYEENLVTKDIEKSIATIIDKYGKKSIDNNEPEFLKEEARNDFRGLFTDLKKKGFAGVRSLAYDYQWDGQSYIEANSEYVTGMSNEEWVEKVSGLRSGGHDYTMTPSADEIAVMKEQVSAWAFDANNQAELEANMMDWFMGIAEDKFDSRKLNPKLNEGGNLNVGLNNRSNSDMILNPNERPNMVKGIKEKGSWFIDGTMFAWDVKTNQWKYQTSTNDKLQPIPGDPQGKFKDGSDGALLFRFSNDPAILEALKGGKKSKASNTDSMSVLPIHLQDTL